MKQFKMTTEIDTNALRKQLIDIYEAHIQDPANQNVKDVAQSVYMTYKGATSLLPKSMSLAISWLINIGLDLEPIPPKEELQRVLNTLKDEQ